MNHRLRALWMVLAAASIIAAMVVWTLAAASGNWGGLTGQGRAFRFSVNPAGDRIDQFRFNIATPCESRNESVGPAQISGDSIEFDSGISSSCQVQISGTFTSPTTATGTLTFTPHNTQVCSCGGVEGAPTLYPPVMTTWSVNQGCAYTLSARTFNADIAATAGSVNVMTAPGCQWTAISQANFVTISSGSGGTGPGAVNFNVAANTDLPGFQTQPRTGTILIEGDPFVISQPGCMFHITPSAAAYGSSGGEGSVDVSAPSACSWDVADLPSWASTTSGGTGSGNGTWRYSVSSHTVAKRSHIFTVAGNVFTLAQLATPLKALTAGSRSTFTVGANGENWSSIAMTEGRSYCADVAPGPTAVDAASPLLTVYRANLSTALNNSGTATPRVCFFAPATETAAFKVTQADASARVYRLRAIETTLWANWFFTGTTYSSYTLLRNTTAAPIEARITWRTEMGAVAGATAVVVGSNGVVYFDARTTAPTAVAGSVEIAHDGGPEALVASQTSFSAVTGLSFDAPALQRVPWQ